MRYLLAITTLLLSQAAAAESLVSLDKMNLNLSKFSDNRDPYTPDVEQTDYGYRAALEFNLSVAKYLFWENNVHTETVNSTVKTVGWHWIAGLRISDGLDAFHEHHSRHVMDEEPKARPFDDRHRVFPVEDSFGLRFKIWDKPEQRKSLFK